MFLNVIINNYLKNLSIDKAILISDQFSISFSYSEMAIILPYIKQHWPSILEDKKRTYLIEELSSKTSPSTAAKAYSLISKLLIIFS